MEQREARLYPLNNPHQMKFRETLKSFSDAVANLPLENIVRKIQEEVDPYVAELVIRYLLGQPITDIMDDTGVDTVDVNAALLYTAELISTGNVRLSVMEMFYVISPAIGSPDISVESNRR